MDKGIKKRKLTRPAKRVKAKGGPEAKPRWTSDAKRIMETAHSARNRIRFRVNDGAIAEITIPT